MTHDELSRCNQYLSKMLVSFETMKHIYQYRTPISLRAFSDFILVTLDNVQEALENPFDQVGKDDIRFNVKEFVERLRVG